MSDNTQKTTIYIVRHGQSEANQVEALGQKDSKLTQLGRDQAAKRAEEFKDIPFSAAYSSDFLRAHETAQIIAAKHKLPITIAKELGERSWGSLEGEKSGEEREEFKRLFAQYENTSKEERFTFKVVPDMESDEEAFNRYINFLHQLVKMYQGKTVLVASHARIMKIFLVNIGYGTYEDFPSGALGHAGFIVLEADKDSFEVVMTGGLERKNR